MYQATSSQQVSDLEVSSTLNSSIVGSHSRAKRAKHMQDVERRFVQQMQHRSISVERQPWGCIGASDQAVDIPRLTFRFPDDEAIPAGEHPRYAEIQAAISIRAEELELNEQWRELYISPVHSWNRHIPPGGRTIWSAPKGTPRSAYTEKQKEDRFYRYRKKKWCAICNFPIPRREYPGCIFIVSTRCFEYCEHALCFDCAEMWDVPRCPLCDPRTHPPMFRLYWLQWPSGNCRLLRGWFEKHSPPGLFFECPPGQWVHRAPTLPPWQEDNLPP